MEGEFERIVLKSPQYHYMMVQLDLFGAKANFDSDLFKNLIVKALKGLHGDVGGSIAVDIIRFEKKSLKSILRVPSIGLVKVWSALTLYSSHNDKPCHFKVSKVSPHLPSLSVNSRDFTSELLLEKV
ncbi:ribonuclease P protein subunit p14-like [Apostichopus japonicus]|uniref:ribonuclease P protein subunit p14-like n=1 Tax=Stichopus japonicus TaxID=307972 RepID=UPI003AB79FF6